MDERLRSNLVYWDACVPAHVESEFYDLEGFKRGRCTLQTVEVQEVGDVRGKSLLPLQCPFGMDTLSWARRGASVTGVDFSLPAIETARALASELGLEARFVHSPLFDLPARLDGEFDVVFTSGGVLCWLPDLRRWAEVIAPFLRPGGVVYVRDFHPTAGMFDDERDDAQAVLRYRYFPSPEPERFEVEGSYAASGDGGLRGTLYEWSHSLGEIVSCIAAVGLRIEFLHEFNACSYRSHPFLERCEDGLWRHPTHPGGLPLMFSLRAVKV